MFVRTYCKHNIQVKNIVVSWRDGGRLVEVDEGTEERGPRVVLQIGGTILNRWTLTTHTRTDTDT